MTQLKKNIPELYLILAVLYYWTLTAMHVNWIAISLLLVLLILLLTKSQPLGLLIGSILIVINLFLVLAMFSELSEFEVFNKQAWQLLGVGTLFLGVNIFVSVLLLLKYSKSKNKQSQSAQG